MPNDLILKVSPGQLPVGACPASYQEMLNLFSANQTVTFPSTFAGVTVSATKPTDTTQAWLQLDSLGRPVRLYYFAQGAWLSQHPMVPDMAMPWFGTLPNFNTFDGGDSNTVSSISGPMWELVTEIAAKFPLAAGTLPSGIVVAAGDTGGEEKHILTEQENGPHTHDLDLITPLSSKWSNGDSNSGKIATGGGALSSGADASITATSPFFQIDTSGGDSSGAGVGHQNMPPYYGMNWIRRSQRLFYVVP